MFFVSTVTSFVPYLLLLGVFVTFMFGKPSDDNDSRVNSEIEAQDQFFKNNLDIDEEKNVYIHSEDNCKFKTQSRNTISDTKTVLTPNTGFFLSKSLKYLDSYHPIRKISFFYSNTGLRAPPEAI
ncbi:MAG: hypothetical protein ACLFNL_04020 [Bacteroidales bacterium]